MNTLQYVRQEKKGGIARRKRRSGHGRNRQGTISLYGHSSWSKGAAWRYLCVLTGRRSRAFLSPDRGFLFNRVRDGADGFRTVTTNATGYGFGLRVASRAGVLGFDYGLGDGGGIGSGKLHVSLRTEF